MIQKQVLQVWKFARSHLADRASEDLLNEYLGERGATKQRD